MKRIISILAVVVAFAFVLTSCADAIVKLSKDLDGTWNATSVKINGEETIPDFIKAYSMTFTDEGEGMGTASITATIDFLGQELTETETGSYQVLSDDNGDMLQIISSGDTTSADLVVDGKTMTLSYTEDGETTVIVADKE